MRPDFFLTCFNQSNVFQQTEYRNIQENYESPLTSKENESVIKVLPTKKNPDGFKGGFKTFKEELTPILLKLFQKTEEGTHSVSSARQRHQKKRKLQTMSLININAKPLNEY